MTSNSPFSREYICCVHSNLPHSSTTMGSPTLHPTTKHIMDFNILYVHAIHNEGQCSYIKVRSNLFLYTSNWPRASYHKVVCLSSLYFNTLMQWNILTHQNSCILIFSDAVDSTLIHIDQDLAATVCSLHKLLPHCWALLKLDLFHHNDVMHRTSIIHTIVHFLNGLVEPWTSVSLWRNTCKGDRWCTGWWHTHIYPTHTYSVCTMVLNYRHAYCEV